MIHIPEIGNHFKILTFEKNENPQNVMVVYTKLNDDCRFAVLSGQPFVDFYWLMNGERYKPTHGLIKKAVRKRLEVVKVDGEDTDRTFLLKVNDLKELSTDFEKPYLVEPHLVVRSEKVHGLCRVACYFPDKQKDGKLIKVNSLYSESKKTFRPPFRKLLALTIRGLEEGTAHPIEQKYTAR
ncbi:MAG: hypothetical protein HC883_03050 [Bdellovibrionaceae bacterium]|nr:hypothetical protein [Pseudobdellovibrionaceae bacterium]